MILGIIPARLASTRLPSKPLADICGKYLIQRTYESAKKSKFLDDIIIAVDDERVENICKSFNAKTIMTPKNIASGTDRLAYAAKILTKPDIIVNIQGDEPFIPGIMIDQAIEPLLFDESIKASTLAKKFSSIEDFNNPNFVKVVFDNNNDALYFSRSPIPYYRDIKLEFDNPNLFLPYKHIGLYVYRREVLLKFASLPQGTLEKLEKLEQLRFLENQIKIRVVETEYDSISVDTPEDLERAIEFCRINNIE